MKNYLKEKVKELYEDGSYFGELHYELLNDVENWPDTQMPDFDEFDGDEDEYEEMSSDLAGEPQDMENFEWISITDDELVVCCGGDWQNPMKITMHLNGDKLVVVDTENGFFEDGLSEEEFNDALGLETPED